MKFLSLLLIFSIQLKANARGQKITLKMKNVPLTTVIREIKNQTGYNVLYDAGALSGISKVNINVNGVQLTEALDQCFKDLPLTYVILDNSIIISRRSVPRAAPAVKEDTEINGRVTDEEGEPLPGVTVSIKNSTILTVTDREGRFRISVPDKEEVALVFTMVGFEQQELVVSALKPVNVVLKAQVSELDEVVVIGYGQQKKVSLTGAVSAINAKELKQTPVANISNSLAGRLTGVMAIQRSGEPGADGASIWIRGQGTYQSSSHPLVLVDGIERSFGDIDPNEIESISILKDASSTAVYGVRGANGVIIVTTKRGHLGKPSINVNVNNGFLTPTRLPEYLESYDALKLYREGLKNDGLNYAAYTDEYIRKFKDRDKPAYEYLYPNVNWMDELLKDFSTQLQTNINVSGGSDVTKYFISASYLSQGGLYNYSEENDYSTQARTQRYNFRSNIDVNLSENLKMELNLGGILLDKNYPGASSGEIFNAIQQTPSWWYPMTNPDGSVAESGKTGNPYAILTQRGYARDNNATLNATAGLQWNMSFLTKGLSSKVRLTFDNNNFRNVNRFRAYKSYQFTIDENETDLLKGNYSTVNDADATLGYDVIANGSRSAMFEGFITYKRSFGQHNIGALALYNQEQAYTAVSGGKQNVVAGLPYRRQGIVGRLTYNYKGKYFFEFDMGYNGSENFPKGKRFGFFPAVSGSWVISEEGFIKNSIPAISLLKIRASAGEVGNDQIGGNRFLYVSTWNTNIYGYNFGYVRDGWYLGGAEESSTGNPNVTWERARKANIGLDLAVLNNRLRFTGDVFYEYRDNILTTPLTIPEMAGVANLPLINAGVVKNRGFETELEYQRDFSKWGYFARANFSFARNKIIEMDEPDYAGREWQENEGRRVGELWGLTALGLFQSWDEIEASPKQSWGNVQPGDIKYKDINDDGVVDALDQGFLGKIENPDKIFGLTLGLHIKDFDCSVLFQGTDGGSVWFTGSRIWPFDRFSNILADVQGNYWSPENTPEQNANVRYPRMVSDFNPNNYQNSTFWVLPNRYLRLKNVEVGYRLPAKLIRRAGFNSVRFYLSGANLLTWDKMEIFDPEMPHGSGNYPQQKVYNLGLSLTF